MIARLLPPNPTLAHRFGNLLYWLFDGMAQDWHRRGVTHVHHGEIAKRVHGLWKRVHSVLERFRARTLRAPRQKSTSPRPSPHSGEGEVRAASAQRIVPGWSVLPRGFGWLKRLFSAESVYHVNAFYPLLHDDAEMQAVIAAAPAQIGRVLRPFCHLLGLEVPAALRLPKRVRGPGSRGGPAAKGGLRDDRGASPRRRRTPREIAAALLAWSERTGKPIDIGKVSSKVWGYIVHWPRDENCPPPEIGYGGRRWRPPKDYKPPERD